VTPVQESGVLKCPVRTSERHAAVLHLEISAGIKGFEGAGEDGGDVFEAVHEGAAVDVVEGFCEEPFFFCVVDLEFAIGGDTRRL